MSNVRSPVSLADLIEAFKLLRPGPEAAAEIARALGFEAETPDPAPTPHEPPACQDDTARAQTKQADGRNDKQTAQDKEKPTNAEQGAPLKVRPLAKPKQGSYSRFSLPARVRRAAPLSVGPRGLLKIPLAAPLLPRRLLRSFLMDAVGDDFADDAVNIEEAVEQVASLRLDRPLPRCRRRGFRSGLQLWIDESPAMRPFAQDAESFRSAVRRIVGPSLEADFFFDTPPFPAGDVGDDAEKTAPPELRPGITLLLLTDLGIGRPPLKPRVPTSRWLSFARSLEERGVRAVALVPYGPARWPAAVTKHLKAVHWHTGPARRAHATKEQVGALARALSISSRIEPTLMREARRRFLPDSDAGLEADLLFSPFVSIYNPRAIELRRAPLLKLRAEISGDAEELRQLSDFHRKYRERIGSHFMDAFEEEIIFFSLRGDLGEMRRALTRMIRALVESEDDSELYRWVLGCLQEFPAWVRGMEEAQQLLDAAELRTGLGLTTGLGSGEFSGRKSWLLPKPTRVGLSLAGDTLTLREPPAPDEPHIEVPATEQRVVFVRASRGKPQAVRFRAGQSAEVRLDKLPVELETLAGGRFRLEGELPQPQSLPPGVKLLHTLFSRGGLGPLRWSPDGRRIATASPDGVLALWDAATGRLARSYEVSANGDSLCWVGKARLAVSRRGRGIVLSICDAKTGKVLRTLEGYFGRTLDVVASPDSRLLASAGEDGAIRLWDARNGRATLTLTAPGVTCLAWSADNKLLASGSATGKVTVWDAGRTAYVFEGHIGSVTSIVFLPDGRALLSSSLDGTIRVWNLTGGSGSMRVLEGHTRGVGGIAVSGDGGFLASAGVGEDALRLWSCDSGNTVALIQEHGVTGLAFSPTSHTLVTAAAEAYGHGSSDGNTSVRVWELDAKLLLRNQRAEVETERQAVHYTTAKVVLVGDSGVGKSGLGWRLAHGEFKEQASTHGQHFWVLPELGKLREDGTVCEAILWDLAGQPDYRLIHALFLDDVDLALVLFDSSDITDPLHGVEFWLKQLRVGREDDASEQGDARTRCRVLLVGAQADRGTPQLTAEELEEFCRRRGLGGYVSTSAKEGQGLEELVGRMKELIPWEEKPATVTTVTFKRIKDYVLRLKEEQQEGRSVVVTPKELRRLEATDSDWEFTDAEMLTAVGHLENYGYVRRLRTSKGEEHVLLAPELLNNLAASFILEARRNPKGLGSLEEQRLLAGEYRFPELEKLSQPERDILLDSAALLFLEHNVCFRETDPLGGRSYLVFPELINLRKPALDDEQPVEDGATYTVRGATENVYASLVVLLGYTQTFTRTDQWRNQARYEVGDRLICGFRQDAERDGELDFVLYFGRDVGRPVRALFQGLFESFLARRNLSVFRFEPVVCSNGHALNHTVVRNRVREGKGFAFCEECGERLALPRADEPIQLTQAEQRKVDEQQWFAARRSLFEQAVFRVMSYVEDQKLARPRCFISYAWGDRAHERWVERSLATDLQKAGINVVLDRWENARVGASVARFIERIEQCEYVVVVGTPLYRKKYENKETSRGYVVAAEVDLISNRLLGTEPQKESVLPLLREGTKEASLPPPLRGRVFADFRDERSYFVTAFDLILSLYQLTPNHPAFAGLRESLR